MTQLLKRVARFYYEGFTGMKLGKTLWLVVLVKLFVMFAVIRLFFMPDVLSQKAPDGDKAGYVSSQIIGKSDINDDD